MLILKLLRFLLPPFHPWKYKWIEYWYGYQDGGYFNEEIKYSCTLNQNEEYIKKYKKIK